MLKHGRANLFKEDQNMADDDIKLEDICNKLIIYVHLTKLLIS